MEFYSTLSEGQKRSYCEQAQARLGLSPTAIEKDFWVCWTLKTLFNLPDWGARFTFKGGTSLSKCWKLIERFSEDIDIVIDRSFLGFGREADPRAATAHKERSRRLKALREVCRSRIQQELQPALRMRISESLPAFMGWSLQADSEDPDGQTLLLHYPSVFAGLGAYVRPVVRIELGARSDTEPKESAEVRPYLSEAFPESFPHGSCLVQAVSPERTFWEKAMLLHEETFRPAGKARKLYLARHYYDIWSLIVKGVARKAAANPELFGRVAAHREVFFRQNWVDYGTLRRGSLRLVPAEKHLPEWRRDYSAMSEMVFGDFPSFEEMLRVVGEFEKEFNHGGGSPGAAPATSS